MCYFFTNIQHICTSINSHPNYYWNHVVFQTIILSSIFFKKRLFDDFCVKMLNN